MPTALGITDPRELAKIARDVPAVVKRNDCYNCLWSGVECSNGCMYEERDVEKQGYRASSRSGPYAGCDCWAYCD